MTPVWYAVSLHTNLVSGPHSTEDVAIAAVPKGPFTVIRVQFCTADCPECLRIMDQAIMGMLAAAQRAGMNPLGNPHK